jgi:phenylacetate-CoA ligase
MDAGIDATIADTDRYPTLTPAGAAVLRQMLEHPAAPIYRNQSGNRLRPEEVEHLRRFESVVAAAQLHWPIEAAPDWVASFVEDCRQRVPHYRDYAAGAFDMLPTISRADLSRDIARFVPDDLPLDRLINFRTSGTTGHPLLLPSHPVVAGSYLAFHKRALRRFGIELTHGRGQVGVILVGFQEKCFTYTSVTPTMDESGLAKINLHLNDWRDAEDRRRYLDTLNAEVYTGDPISFAELLRLGLTTRPRALISTSMALSEGLRSKLERHFECPVLDVYSMNEAGPIAVHDARLGGHVLLQNRMFVEITDSEGRRLPPGERGEITLTGGFNTYLPLIRYRTGDFAALEQREGEFVLTGLQGRPPVRFRSENGEWKNNIEVTRALQGYAFPQYTLRQQADGSFIFTTLSGSGRLDDARATLTGLFGPGSHIVLREVPRFDDKVVQYTTELIDA